MSAQALLTGLTINGFEPRNPEKPVIPVVVRPQDRDSLNAYDRNPEMMKNLSVKVIKSDEFQKRDALALPIVNRMVDIFPMLTGKKKGSDASPTGAESDER